jgi:hypothetical protein
MDGGLKDDWKDGCVGGWMNGWKENGGDPAG